MPPNMKHILTNMNVKVCSWPLTFRKVVRQTDLRGGDSLLHRSCLNLTVKKIWKLVDYCRRYRETRHDVYSILLSNYAHSYVCTYHYHFVCNKTLINLFKFNFRLYSAIAVASRWRHIDLLSNAAQSVSLIDRTTHDASHTNPLSSYKPLTLDL